VNEIVLVQLTMFNKEMLTVNSIALKINPCLWWNIHFKIQKIKIKGEKNKELLLHYSGDSKTIRVVDAGPFEFQTDKWIV
jgi:hypothetical protein